MRKLRPKSLKEIVEMYKKQYDENYQLWDGRCSNDVLRELLALPPKASSKQISDVIGNGGWAQHVCAECSTYFSRGVAFGYDAEEVLVCYSCIRKALKL